MDLENFLTTYNNLTLENIEVLRLVYTDDITFIDPAHKIIGIEKLIAYFSSLYKNVNSVGFEFGQSIIDDNRVFIQWKMNFSHPRLKKGGTISVAGGSLLEFSGNGKIRYHRDYFDLGEMIYQHIPFVGNLITSIKRRLGK